MKNLKKFAALGLSAAMVLSLAACGSGTKNTTTDTTAAKTEEAAKTEAAGDTEAGDKAAAGGDVDKSQKLIIYTNSGSNGRDAWLKEKAGRRSGEQNYRGEEQSAGRYGIWTELH